MSAHVLMCCNDAYVKHMAVCCVSLIENNPALRFEFVLVCNDIAPQSRSRLKSTLQQYPAITYTLLDQASPALNSLLVSTYYTKEMWARFWVDEYFAPDVSRVLYLDPDIVVTGNVETLFTIPLEGRLLAAVSIPGSEERIRALEIPPERGYFNSGVLVLDVAKWRAIGARDALLAYAAAHGETLPYGDQDALNACFHADRLTLDYTWNAISPFYRDGADLPVSPAEIQRVRREARIVHFNGQSKPWTFMCRHPAKPRYLEFRSRTPWRDQPFADRSPANVAKKAAETLLGPARVARLKALLGSQRSPPGS